MNTKLLSALALFISLQFIAAAVEPADKLVVHEWGTFTSVQGDDGVQFEWNPFTVAELPGFVYDRSRPGTPGGNPVASSPLSKSYMRTLQRMETPVIYCYADKECDVDIKVEFPQGVVTEWYPNVSAYGPYSGAAVVGSPLLKKSEVRWDRVKVLPAIAHPELAKALAMDKSGSHYYAARATDSAYLKMQPAGPSQKAPEVDKFLFYRGVGGFTAPLQASLPGADEQFLKLQNNSKEQIKSLFVLRIKGAQAKLVRVEQLDPKQDRTVRLDGDKDLRPIKEIAGEIGRQLEAALVAEGLYPREAAAMVATWRDSWFEEQGLRVLYTLPRAWTDQILPLEIKPAPEHTERVFVGRAELITPAMEFAMLKQVVRFADAEGAARTRVADQTRQLGFGRFAEPTMHRLMNANANREFRTIAAQLLQAAFGKPKLDPADIPLEPAARSVAASQFE